MGTSKHVSKAKKEQVQLKKEKPVEGYEKLKIKSISMRTVTPEQAAKWLDSNSKNRKMSKSR